VLFCSLRLLQSSLFLDAHLPSLFLTPTQRSGLAKLAVMAKGDLELLFKQTQGQSDFYSVSGSFVMNLEKTGGYGGGTATGQVKGKVKNGIMKAKISGVAQVEDGSAHISGEIIGTISKTKAFGTWRMGHIDGSHSGKWTVEKVVE
jgi:hypothetical protein